MIKYFDFTSKTNYVSDEECTTRWSDTIKCSIILSGTYNGFHHNIMRMEDTTSLVDIDRWAEKNVGKVKEIIKEEAETLGKNISPIVEKTITCKECGNVYTIKATAFTVDKGQIWDKVTATVEAK